MTNIDSMQIAITQAAVKTATLIVMVLKEADTGSTTGANLANMGEVHIPRDSRPALRQPAFNWKAPYKYIVLLSFEMEVTSILQTGVYELNDGQRVAIIKNCLGKAEL